MIKISPPRTMNVSRTHPSDDVFLSGVKWMTIQQTVKSAVVELPAQWCNNTHGQCHAMGTVSNKPRLWEQTSIC